VLGSRTRPIKSGVWRKTAYWSEPLTINLGHTTGGYAQDRQNGDYDRMTAMYKEF